MKKFLAILLIAIVACETVEEFDLQGWMEDLKNAGIFDLVKSKIISYGKQIAKNFCSNYLPSAICSIAVDALAAMLGV